MSKAEFYLIRFVLQYDGLLCVRAGAVCMFVVMYLVVTVVSKLMHSYHNLLTYCLFTYITVFMVTVGSFFYNSRCFY